MSAPCSNFTRMTGFKIFLLTLFVLVNVVLYVRSRYIDMETITPQRTKPPSAADNPSRGSLSNYSSRTLHNSFNTSINAVQIMLEDTHQQLMSQRKLLLAKPFFQEKIINPHNFQYIIRPNVSCSGREVELVICVVISQDNFKGRSTIRNTFGSYAQDRKNNAILVFFIGSKKKGSNLTETFNSSQTKILEEAAIYGDILQEDYIDSYENLSLKSVSLLKWVSYFCPNTKFILKVDDDMYVNIPFMIKILRAHVSEKSIPSAFVMGSMQVDAQPIRNPSSKWYTPYSMFSESTYPKYVSGTAYVMTSEAAFLLYEASLRVPKFWLEDIYITGLCSRKASVKVYDNEHFSYSKPEASGCRFKTHVSGHRYTHAEIIKIHTELYDPNLVC